MDKPIGIKPVMTATKVSDTQIEVTTQPVTPDPIVQTYDRAFLEQQLIDIQAQKDAFDAQRDKEMADVQALLDLCDSVGVAKTVLPDASVTNGNIGG